MLYIIKKIVSLYIKSRAESCPVVMDAHIKFCWGASIRNNRGTEGPEHAEGV